MVLSVEWWSGSVMEESRRGRAAVGLYGRAAGRGRLPGSTIALAVGSECERGRARAGVGGDLRFGASVSALSPLAGWKAQRQTDQKISGRAVASGLGGKPKLRRERGHGSGL